jgi:methionine-rich copper-binding protein CopC
VIGTATAGNASATVNFSAPGVTGLTGFLVQPIDPGTHLAVGAATPAPAGATSALVTGLANGVPVAFIVAATNEFGTGAYSAPSNTVTPVAPAGPAVVNQLPGNGATGVAVNQVITASFSANVTGVSTGPNSTNVQLRVGTTTGPRVPATVTYVQGAAGRVLTIRPNALLATGTTYVVVVTGGTATTGIRTTPAPSTPVPTTSWSFTTVANAAPFLLTQAPAPGATGVARGAVVTARFSEAVVGVSTTTATLTRAGARAPIAATVTYNAVTNTVTIRPAANLRAGTVYTVTLTGGPTAIREAAATALPFQTVTWTFTT